MNPRERKYDLKDGILAALEGWQKGIWTCLPCIVTGFDPSDMTVSCVPAIQMQQKLESGAVQWITITELRKVPLKVLHGGIFLITLPVAVGNECVVHFSSRCFDAWWQSGGIQPQSEFRMHDLSDGFADVGPYSVPEVPSDVSTTNLQIRSLDGKTIINISDGKIEIIADEVVIHGRNKTTFDAGGTGFVYTPALVTTYTDGVPTMHFPPNPPEVPT